MKEGKKDMACHQTVSRDQPRPREARARNDLAYFFFFFHFLCILPRCMYFCTTVASPGISNEKPGAGAVLCQLGLGLRKGERLIHLEA